MVKTPHPWYDMGAQQAHVTQGNFELGQGHKKDRKRVAILLHILACRPVPQQPACGLEERGEAGDGNQRVQYVRYTSAFQPPYTLAWLRKHGCLIGMPRCRTATGMRCSPNLPDQ